MKNEIATLIVITILKRHSFVKHMVEITTIDYPIMITLSITTTARMM